MSVVFIHHFLSSPCLCVWNVRPMLETPALPLKTKITVASKEAAASNTLNSCCWTVNSRQQSVRPIDWPTVSQRRSSNLASWQKTFKKPSESQLSAQNRTKNHYGCCFHSDFFRSVSLVHREKNNLLKLAASTCLYLYYLFEFYDAPTYVRIYCYTWPFSSRSLRSILD